MPEQRTEMGNSQGRIKNDTHRLQKIIVKLRNTTVNFNTLKNITNVNTKLSRMSGYQLSHLFLLGT